MNQTQPALSTIWNRFQTTLFPWLREQLGDFTSKQQQLIEVLEITQIEAHIPYTGRGRGRPSKDRRAIARAFIAKAVYNMSTTEILLDRLESDIKLRRVCGWEQIRDLPSRSTFSRAFAEFAEYELTQKAHAQIIDDYLGEQLIGHISRDSTSIHAREKPEEKKAVEKQRAKKRGRPKKGEERIKEPTRIEKQFAGMSIAAMKSDLPTACNVGTKKSSKGYKTSWIGYKLHIDAADNGIPVSCLLTSASLHDSQVAIPLAEITHQRIDSCYDLMDAAYDAPLIKQHSESMGHVPLIDENPRTTIRKAELKLERKAKRNAGYKLPADVRYNERSTVERVNGRLKDDFGARMVRVKGHAKVMSHLMFGVIALTVEQLMRYAE
jgi:transposase